MVLSIVTNEVDEGSSILKMEVRNVLKESQLGKATAPDGVYAETLKLINDKT